MFADAFDEAATDPLFGTSRDFPRQIEVDIGRLHSRPDQPRRTPRAADSQRDQPAEGQRVQVARVELPDRIGVDTGREQPAAERARAPLGGTDLEASASSRSRLLRCSSLMQLSAR